MAVLLALLLGSLILASLNALVPIETVLCFTLILLIVAHLVRTFRQRDRDLPALEAQERLHLLGHATQDVVYDWDLRTDRAWLSEAVLKRYGYPAGQIASALCWWKAKLNPVDHDRVVDSLLAAINGSATARTAAYHFKRSDGTYAFVIDRGVLVRDENGEAVRMVGTVMDVTEQKATEEDLRRSEEQCRGLIDRASDVILTIATNTVIMSANPVTERATGWPLQNLIGSSIIPFIHPDDRARMTQAMDAASFDDTASVEFRFLHHLGPYVDFETTMTPNIVSGNRTGTTAIARDITRRRFLEAEREETSQQIQLLLDSLSEGICATDESGRCTLVNRAAAKILGRPPHEMLGQQLHEVIHPSSSERCSPASGCVIHRVLITGSAETVIEQQVLMADERSVPLCLTVSPILERGCIHGVVASFVDVTERKLLESQLERANRLGALGRVSAGIAHEFNNVLMAIQPAAELVARKSDDEMIHGAASRIVAAVNRGRSTTQEILRFTRRAEPKKSAIPVTGWLEGLRDDFRGLLPEGVNLEVELPPETLWIEGDKEQLSDVLANLVLNARDAMGAEGTLRIGVQRCFSGASYSFGNVQTPDLFLHLVVSDTGAGIREEVRQHIFDPFFTTKRRGTGLGLSIAYQVVALHEGHIFVESTVGRGTSFHLFLPLSARTFFHEANVAELIPKVPARPSGAPFLLLVVEDDPDVAEGIISLLTDAGQGVILAEFGADVIPAIERHHPTAVLLDLGLPDIPGEVVYEQIAARWPMLPVIISSGHADPAQVPGSGRKNVAFLPKPYAIEQLLAILASVA